MKKIIYSIVVCCALPLMASAQQIIQRTLKKVESPDGKYVFTFYQRTVGKENTRMYYTLSYNGQTIIKESELGINIDNRLFESALAIPNDTCHVWTENLVLTKDTLVQHKTTWTPLYGENKIITDNYNALTLSFRKGDEVDLFNNAGGNSFDKHRFYYMNVEVRAYDEGVAFRYHFPEATNGLFLHITGERTSFTFPEGTRAWYENWAQGPYNYVPLQQWKGESERPLLLKLPQGMNVALCEARLVDFVRGKYKLADDKPSTLQVSLYSPADVITPYDTPWRVVMASEKAIDLINHKDLILNLNDSCKIQDTDFIKPGKAFRCGRLDQKSALKAIDFAAERGIQYVHLDAGWYGPEMLVESDATHPAVNRDLDMPALCKYASSKGIGLWVYVNQRALYNQLDKILPLYRKWGIKGIKFGFVQIGNQQWTTWLHSAVRKCADYGLMVDIHDEYRPTGYSRTYPNLLTQEGVRGNEEMPDANHNTLLPFTRFLAGPADYTLCYYNTRVKNTKAQQLAMAVVYYSPLQFLFWYDAPESYKGEKELQFWKDTPVVWDESKALQGEPGEYIVQARRSGNDWYVGMMTNKSGRRIVLDTKEFLVNRKRYTAEIYTDDPNLKTRTKVRTTVRTVKGGEKLTFELQPSGGAALRFVPVNK